MTCIPRYRRHSPPCGTTGHLQGSYASRWSTLTRRIGPPIPTSLYELWQKSRFVRIFLRNGGAPCASAGSPSALPRADAALPTPSIAVIRALRYAQIGGARVIACRPSWSGPDRLEV